MLREDVPITFNHPSDTEVALPFLLFFFEKLALHVHEVDLLEKVLYIVVLEAHVRVHSQALSMES